MAHEIQITIDCADPRPLSAFWAEMLGYVIPDPPDGSPSWDDFLAAQGVPEDQWNIASACEDPDGHGPRLFFQQVPEAKQVKNRVHIDVRAAPGLEGEARMAALESRAEELVERGATRIERHEPNWLGAGHIVMVDPEGNEFCLD